MNNKNIIDIGSNALGGVVGESISAASFLGSRLLGAVVGPIVSAVTGDVFQRMLSKSETDKVNYVTKDIVDKVELRLQAGEPPRQDDYFANDEYHQSSASKLLEETLLKCKQEFEAKKLAFYSNFWSNICFENGVSYETANSIIGQFSALSYRQIQLLVYLNTGATIQIGKWEKYMFENHVLSPYYTVYSDSLHLYNVRLAAHQNEQKGVINIGTPEIRISPSGKLMCQLMNITLQEKELNDIKYLVTNIDAIVERLMKENMDDGSDNTISPLTADDVEQIFEEKKNEILAPIDQALSKI